MRILVTGATGFVGGALAARLVELGHDVVGIGRDAAGEERLKRKGAAFARLDLAADDGRLPALCRGCDALVHAAALVAPWGP